MAWLLYLILTTHWLLAFPREGLEPWVGQHSSGEGHQPLGLLAVGEMSASVLTGNLAGASEHPFFVSLGCP